MSVWRKGCLCGCLIPEECRDYEPPAQRVEVVHVHHIVLRDKAFTPAPRAWVDDVEIIREIEP